jgi:internalin A
LTDASALAKLKSLKKLHVEKCKHLRDFSFLAGASELEELFVSELDSIAFVPKLKHLKLLKFWDLADGNVAPALDAPALAKVDLYPDRKHYTHTKAEINAQLAR